MKKITTSVLVFAICFVSFLAMAKNLNFKKALVDFDAFEKLAKEAKKHRALRLVNVDEFLRMSKEKNTVILDTRSDAMYNAKHVKGAIHLDFTDFTDENLRKVIPSTSTRILIYCNNNFDEQDLRVLKKPQFFVSKMASPSIKFKDDELTTLAKQNQLTLALNIPTYINLYGYGYKNVYELNELLNTLFDRRIEFEGSAVK